MELTGNHIRAARVLAGMDQAALAKKSGISINTIRNMEAAGTQRVGGRASTRGKVQACLEAVGIEFTNGDSPGVRLVRGRAKSGRPRQAKK